MKRVLIFTSAGGGGHLSASNAIKQQLEAYYTVETRLIFEVLSSIDVIRFFTFQKYGFEDFYNYLLKKQYLKILNLCIALGLVYFRLRPKKITAVMTQFLSKDKPDLIISVIPLFNQYIHKAAQQLSIPFILVPTDLDITTFVTGIQDTYPKFKLALAFEDPACTKLAESHAITKRHMAVTGFPLKKDFFKTDLLRTSVHQEFSIDASKPVIMILMGAQGSFSTYTLARELQYCVMPVHIIFCLGRNESLRAKIQALQFGEHVSYSIVGFTNKISELMSVSDLIITKSGSVSVCEALYKNIPIILDGTSDLLLWEKFNHSFIEQHKFGRVLKHPRELCFLIEQFLSKPVHRQYKKNIELLEKKQGVVEIEKLVKEMI